jgi:exonuclease VII small subunit
MRELESIVRDLETGKAKLDDAVRAYERGAALKERQRGNMGSLHDLPKTARLRGMPITIAFRGNFERGF